MRAFKTELALSRWQARHMNCTFGVVRVAYNRYLAAAENHYQQTGKFLTGYEYSRILNHQPVEDWFRAVSSKAVKQAILNGDKAYKRFFNHKANKPRMRKKGVRDSYYLIGSIHVERHRIKLPCLGWVRLKEKGYIPTDLKPRSATVSRRAGRYYVSVLFDTVEPEPAQSDGDVLGMDVGITSLAVLSDGTKYPNHNKTIQMRKLYKRARRLDRKLARQRAMNKKIDARNKQSTLNNGTTVTPREWKNYNKTLRKRQALLARITNAREDNMYRTAIDIVQRKPSALVMEDLNIKGMMRNKHLAPALQKQSLSRFMMIVQQECLKHGVEVRVANRWFPSSKLCNACGTRNKELRLSQRSWACPACGTRHDRDVNAAMNLRDTHEYTIKE